MAGMSLRTSLSAGAAASSGGGLTPVPAGASPSSAAGSTAAAYGLGAGADSGPRTAAYGATGAGVLAAALLAFLWWSLPR